ncbi:hypothetical protein ACFLTQ_01050 [Chloroflexota bacterium]
MKNIRIVLAAAMTIVLVLSGAILGCELFDQYPYAIDGKMMDRFPMNVEDFKFINIKDIEDDDDLKIIYDDWRTYVASSLELFGIDADDVDGYASGGGVEIYEDGFDTEVLMERLGQSGYKQGTYRDIEIWKNTDWIALIKDDMVIVGTESGVKSCIDVIEYDEDSLLDNEDAKDVITDDDIDSLIFSVYHREYAGFTALVAGGGSFWDRKDTLKAHLIFKFASEAAAEAAVDDIEAEFAHFEDLDVDLDDEFVDVTGEMPVEEWWKGYSW